MLSTSFLTNSHAPTARPDYTVRVPRQKREIGTVLRQIREEQKLKPAAVLRALADAGKTVEVPCVDSFLAWL